MTREERQKMIQKYAVGHQEVVESLANFPEGSLPAHPFAGKWSAREIVHHLADSETTAGMRLRRLLTEEYPVIQGYDQEAYAILLRYNLRTDLGPSLEALRAARAGCLQLIEHMTDEDWKRSGWHTEAGLYTATRWLEIYADHAHNHAAQIRRLREALAK